MTLLSKLILLCSLLLHKSNIESWVSAGALDEFPVNHPMEVVRALETAIAGIPLKELTIRSRDIFIESGYVKDTAIRHPVYTTDRSNESSVMHVTVFNAKRKDQLRAVLIGFNNLASLLQSIQQNVSATSTGSKHFVQNSSVIVCTIYDKNMTKASLPITFSLKLPAEVKQPSAPAVQRQTYSCEFYNDTTSQWSALGCSVKNVSRGYITCSCNHTTTFAVLLINSDLSHLATKPTCRSWSIITVATYVTSSISIFFAIVTLASFQLAKAVNSAMSERHLTHAHLTAAILGMHVTSVLSDVASASGHALCIAIAFVTHCTSLSAFAWMTVEGLLLYFNVIVVNLRNKSLGRLKYVIGWGAPIVISATTLGVGLSYDAYVYDVQSLKVNASKPTGQRRLLCWLHHSSSLSWANTGPILVMLFLNSVILLRVLCLVFRLAKKANRFRPAAQVRNSQTTANHSEEQNNEHFISDITVACNVFMKLFPLLGVTWFIGWAPNLLPDEKCSALDSTASVLTLTHVLLNGLQGFFLFVVCVVTDEAIGSALNRRLNRFKGKSQAHQYCAGGSSKPLP